MKEISLTQGKVALVDDEDYPELSKYRWHVTKSKKLYYAARNSCMVGGKRQRIYMHRAIINPPLGKGIDHIDGDGCNNQRVNLRAVTHRENMQNIHVEKTSKFPGVYWNRYNQNWQVRILIGNVSRYLGSFDNEKIAALAYINACEDPAGTILRLERDKTIRRNSKTSRFIGVHWSKVGKKWAAQIIFNRKFYHLGYYENEEKAALRYRIAHDWQAIKL